MSDGPISIREFVIAIMDEREKRYLQMFADVKAASALALEGVKEANALSLQERDKAAIKEETGTARSFEKVNEFRGMATDNIAYQQQTFIPRLEANAKMEALDAKLDTVMGILSKISGAEASGKSSAEWLKWAVGIIVGIGLALLLQYLRR
jgi:hypothetical protein